jgi:hypothetical protein
VHRPLHQVARSIPLDQHRRCFRRTNICSRLDLQVRYASSPHQRPGPPIRIRTLSRLSDPEFIQQFRKLMNDLRPTPTSRHGNKHIFTFRNLKTCSHDATTQSNLPFNRHTTDPTKFSTVITELSACSATVVRPPSRQITSNPHTSPMKTHHNPQSLH